MRVGGDSGRLLHMNGLSRFVSLVAFSLCGSLSSVVADSAVGYVFEDLDRDGVRDDGERGIEGVAVSNQIDVVLTDSGGRWELPVGDESIFFVIKPRGWMTPVDENNLPQFYYNHKPLGSPKLKFLGVEPTGELPASIDFPLHRHEEPDMFKAVFFGDPQPRDQKELDYIAHDVVEELVGTDAKFGVTLGDILFDNLSLFSNNNALIALIGIPWYNVIGNHDINFDSVDDRHSDETFERFYGPSYHAYSHGPVHFVVLDNVVWGGRKPEGSGSYTGGLGADQLKFVENLLPHIPEDELIMFMMHIPITGTSDAEALFRLIENRPYTMSISGHTHWHAHLFLDEEAGWRGETPHHHVVNVTVSGSWWTGEPDENGIPHTTMRDGAPNGYTFIAFDGHEAVVDFKAARRPESYQMNVMLPEVVSRVADESAEVFVNVFNGSEKSTVSVRVGAEGEWTDLEKTYEKDPGFVALKAAEVGRVLLGRPLSSPVDSHHLWKGRLPAVSEPGVHRLWVKTEDMYGRTFNASRTFRVE